MRKLLWMPVLLSLVLVSAGAGILLFKHQQAVLPAAKSSAQPPAVVQDAGSPVVSVNALAASPHTHLGAVRLTGVVATVEPGQRFVLIDQREFQACGIGCLGEADTKKITVRWAGKAPTVGQSVQVSGNLALTAKGYTFTARKVACP